MQDLQQDLLHLRNNYTSAIEFTRLRAADITQTQCDKFCKALLQVELWDTPA